MTGSRYIRGHTVSRVGDQKKVLMLVRTGNMAATLETAPGTGALALPLLFLGLGETFVVLSLTFTTSSQIKVSCPRLLLTPMKAIL